MKLKFVLCLSAAMLALGLQAEPYRSLRELGLSPTNTAAANKEILQKAIDSASRSGAALFLDPSEDPYPVDGGITLKRNVSIIGVHGPVGRGRRTPEIGRAAGSVRGIE